MAQTNIKLGYIRDPESHEMYFPYTHYLGVVGLDEHVYDLIGGSVNNYIPLAGSSSITGNLTAATNNSIDLGDVNHIWKTVYAGSISNDNISFTNKTFSTILNGTSITASILANSNINLGNMYVPLTGGTVQGQLLMSKGTTTEGVFTPSAPEWTSLNLANNGLLKWNGTAWSIDTNQYITSADTYKFTLNGTTYGDTDGIDLSNSGIYAPLNGGNAYSLLMSSGNGAPVWMYPWSGSDTPATKGGYLRYTVGEYWQLADITLDILAGLDGSTNTGYLKRQESSTTGIYEWVLDPYGGGGVMPYKSNSQGTGDIATTSKTTEQINAMTTANEKILARTALREQVGNNSYVYHKLSVGTLENDSNITLILNGNFN